MDGPHAGRIPRGSEKDQAHVGALRSRINGGGFRDTIRDVMDNYFLAETPMPDPTGIKAALGDKFPWYEGVLAAATDFTQDWKHYGKKYGWKLKVHDGAKTLFELSVAPGSFRIGMAVRERELLALREDSSLEPRLGGLLDADKAKEGWGIKLVVEDDESYGRAVALIEAVTAIRQP